MTYAHFRTGLLAAVAGLSLLLAGCDQKAPDVKGAEPTLRLLSESQYRNTIADLFGAHIVVGGTFDPLIRTNGLLTVGTTSAHISPVGFEQFDRMARSIAAQVMSEKNRDIIVPCKPADATKADEACATKFFSTVGRMVFRRALTDAEVQIPVAMAKESATKLNNFYDGLASGLSGMLVSPAFLFNIDTTEPDPDRSGQRRLDDYAKAARLSYFLWNTTPDDELLRAAEKGELQSHKGLKTQVDRMLASPKLEAGMRAFFDDMLAFEGFSKIEKDSIIYPSFSAAVAEDAREQTLRTIIDLLITQDGDYRDLFTTRKTFMSGPLGRIYRVPVDRPDGGWTPFEFDESDPRAGLLTHVSFTALYAHPGRSSPTLRGRAIRESLLCQKVPDPPGNVDFSLFNDPNSPNRTARDRLTAHATAPACAGCHKLTDPVGLGMEQIDGAGQYRTTENDAVIETAGNLDGIPYTDAVSLGQAMRDNPALPSCLVNRLYSYATAREPQRNDRPALKFFTKNFINDGYRLKSVLRELALSDTLYAIAMPPVRSAAHVPEKDDKS
ncbi:MAG: DUF1592 domain-containing protein [Rhodospirillaceae bacterium]|nr:DUF1592 domain-containing protein [Rhodospirillaceae bacterium]